MIVVFGVVFGLVASFDGSIMFLAVSFLHKNNKTTKQKGDQGQNPLNDFDIVFLG